ncbi:MAG: hypothetical protein HQK50_19435 [Oligoflexia bacterium]|nr:hypothetical protein [Oligoflexia bacterium]
MMNDKIKILCALFDGHPESKTLGTKSLSIFEHPEDWEIETELYYGHNWEGLLKYQEQLARERPDCIEEQWKLCDRYIDNGLYEKALCYLSRLYNKDPDNYDIVHLLIEVLLLLGVDEGEFNWKRPPRVLRLSSEILDICYDYLRLKRKPRSLFELYSNLWPIADYLDFDEKDLLGLIDKDERFSVGNHEILCQTEVYIKMRKNNKISGHYCWCCGQIKSNEKFSGKNHGRHLCKDCTQLGKEELQFRQVKRDVNRLIGWEGTVSHRNKKALEKYLKHPDKRIADLASSAFIEDRNLRLLWKREEEERKLSNLDDEPF